MGEDFSKVGICVDLFLFPAAYIDVATVGSLSSTTGGDLYLYPNFDVARDGLQFMEDIKKFFAFLINNFVIILEISESDQTIQLIWNLEELTLKKALRLRSSTVESLKKKEYHHFKFHCFTQTLLAIVESEFNYVLPNIGTLDGVFRWAEMDINYLAKASVAQASITSVKNFGTLDSTNNIRLPPAVRLSSTRLESNGVYLLENGVQMFCWVGRNVSPEIVQGLFGVQRVEEIDVKIVNPRLLPILENKLNRNVRQIISLCQLKRPRYLELQIVRQRLDLLLEVEFAYHLVEDQNHDAMTYVDYLCFIH
ncbi:Protein transport protein Sec24C, partial [Physocladia obscura]